MLNLKNILIVDDDKDYLQDLSLLLKDKFNIYVFTDPAKSILFLKTKKMDLLILDIELKKTKSGIDWIEDFLAFDPFLPIIIISYHSSPKIVVEAINKGAIDYIHKGSILEEIEQSLQYSIEKINKIKIQRYQESLPANGIMVYKSKVMDNIVHEVEKVAKTDCSILLTGESGVGKSLLAKYIHRISLRADKNFVIIHAPSITDNLFESELFGYEKGAFTGADTSKIGKVEFAEGGTLVIEEITETSTLNQSKLLRLIDNREFEKVGGVRTISANIRFISTTNRNIQDYIKSGNFREDLFFRISTYPIEIPPLRKRIDDIIPLAEHAINVFNIKLNKKIIGLTEGAKKYLSNYDWPGNARELFNMIERSMIKINNERMISKAHIDEQAKTESIEYSLPYHEAVKML
jgi:two-component system response regulator FlrC